MDTIQRENKQIYKMLRLQQAITKYTTHSSFDLEECLLKILKTISKAFKFHYSIIWLTNEQGIYECVTHHTTKALEKEDFVQHLRNFHIKKDSGLIYYTIVQRKTKIIQAFSTPPRNKRLKYLHDNKIKCCATFPIIVENNLIGVLELGSKKKNKLTDFSCKFIDILCSQLGQLIKRRRHNEEITQSEDKYRALVELAPEIIYSVTAENKIASINSAIEKMSGLEKDNFIGKPLETLFSPNDRKAILKRLQNSRTTKKPTLIQATLVTKNKKPIFVEIVESIYKLTNNEARRFGIIIDVTQRFLLEKQKVIWIAMASHELRTPITSIKAFTQILQAKEKDKTNQKYLAKVNAMADQMTNIIDDFLDATRLNTQELAVNKTKTKINTLIKDVVETIQPSVNHQLEIELDQECSIKIDKKRVRQLLYNLISNAVKYSPGKNKIHIKTTLEVQNILFSITDFGIGLTKTEAKKIFEAFYRSKNGSGASGLGLGLFISQAVVNAHNGQIWVESEENKGTTFFVRLPV